MLELALALHRIGRPRILIVGDYIQDIAHDCEAVRFAQEASHCPVWRRNGEPTYSKGGAGAVEAMGEALGADTILAYGGSTYSSTKMRFFVNGVQQLRFDRDAERLSAEQTDRIAAHIADEVQRADVVLVADYSKGVCVPSVLRAAIDGAKARGIPVIVDPAHGVDWKRYSGAACIKCNAYEWETCSVTNVTFEGEIIVTYGERGMLHFKGTQHESRPRRVVDTCGAGDAVLAALGVCVAGGMSWPDACRVANSAAGLKVERRGAVPVPKCEVIADLLHGLKIIPSELLPDVANSDKGIVWTNGCFDGPGLHRGHLHSLAEAKKQGDVLIVGVNGDRSVAALKGSGRPISPILDRMGAVAALECVDYVVEVQDEQHLARCLERVAPDVMVKSEQWRGRVITGAEFAKELVFVSEIPDCSTTSNLRKMNESAKRANA